MPSRRAYLASLAALAPLGGCTALDGASTPSPTATPDPIEPLGTPVTVDGVTVTPHLAWTQHTAYAYENPEVWEVVSFDGEVLLFAVTAAPGPDGVHPFELHVESSDASLEGSTDVLDRIAGSRFPAPDGVESWRVEYVGFEVPPDATIGDDAVLRYDPSGEPPAHRRWRLPDDVVAALQAEPPDFVVENVILPDSVLPGGEVDVVFEVRNDGGPGTFRAIVHDRSRQFGFETVELALDAGERDVAGATVGVPAEPDGSTIEVPIETADGTETRTVPLAE